MSTLPEELIPTYRLPPYEDDGLPQELWTLKTNGRRSVLNPLSPAEVTRARSLITELEARKDYERISRALEPLGFRIQPITKPTWDMLGKRRAPIIRLVDDAEGMTESELDNLGKATGANRRHMKPTIYGPIWQ